MKKGLLFVCAALICFVFAAYAIPAKQTVKNIKESDEIKRDYSAPIPKAPIWPGVVISTTGYADAWRSTAQMQGKSIVVYSDGSMMAVAHGRKPSTGTGADLMFSYSYDYGATWSNSTLASKMNIRIYNGLALDQATAVPYIVWQDRTLNSIQWMRDEGAIGGGGWTTPDTLARDSMAWYLPALTMQDQKMAMSAFAHGLVTPVGDFSIHMVMSEDQGATWMAPWGRLPLPYGWNRWTNNTFYPGWDEDNADWIFSPSGDTVIGYFDVCYDTTGYNITGGEDGYYAVYKISYDGGVTWSGIQVLDPPQQYSYGGWWYRFDGTWVGDRPHLLYVCSDSWWNGIALFEYHPTVAGDYSNWTMSLVSDISGNQAINFNGGVTDCPTISYDDAGNIFATYQDWARDTSSQELFGAASTDGGNTWLTPVQLTTTHGGLDGNIYCEAAENVANDLVHVIYQDSVYQNIYYYSYPTATLLAAPVRPDPITLPCELVSQMADSLEGAAGGPVGDGTVDVMTNDTLYFIWSPKVPIDGTYELLASTTSDFSAGNYQFTNGYITRNYAWDGTQYPDDIGVIGMPSNGVWYWKVRSHRGTETSPWSEVFDFDYQGVAINTTDWVTGVTGNPVSVTHPFVLNQSRPNPVRGIATISFSLPKAGAYSLKVYNVAGQVVSTSNGYGNAGMNTVNVNSKNLSNGVYFYQLNANNNTATRKMVVLK